MIKYLYLDLRISLPGNFCLLKIHEAMYRSTIHILMRLISTYSDNLIKLRVPLLGKLFFLLHQLLNTTQEKDIVVNTAASHCRTYIPIYVHLH